MSVISLSKNYTGFDPRTIPGCTLWLDASDTSSYTLSGTTITGLTDKSPNAVPLTVGTNYVQSSTFNGSYKSFLCNNFPSGGSTVYLAKSSSFSISTPFTVFCVAQRTATVGGLAGFLMDNLTGTNTNRVFIWDPTSSNVWHISPYASVTTAPSSTASVISGQISSSPNFYQNGTLFPGTLDSIPSSQAGITIGGSGGGGGFGGHICEFMIFSGVFSTAQRQLIEGYLARKWGLLSSLPGTHPYKTNPLFTRPFQPTDILGCSLWLDAADASTITQTSGTVSSVLDKSGNGKNLTGGSGFTYPNNTFNGTFPSFYNASSKSSLLGTNSSFSISQPLTAFIVGQSLLGSGAYGALIDGTVSPIYFYYYNSGSLSVLLYAGSQIQYSGAASTFINSYYANTTSSQIFVNGTSVVTGNIGSSVLTSILIGNANGLSTGFIGHICEITMYNSILTASQRQQVEGYLANKWGLRSSLPSTQPFKLFPPLTTLFNPLNLSGCALWLDGADPNGNGVIPSNGTSISTWVDKSGSGNTVTGASSQPTYTTNVSRGIGALSFNGSQWLSKSSVSGGSLAGNNTTTISMFVVCSFSNNTLSSSPITWDSPSFTYRIMLQYHAPTPEIDFDFNNFPNPRVNIAPFSPTNNQLYIFSGVRNASVGYLGINGGVTTATASGLTSQNFSGTSNTLNVGTYVNNTGYNMKGTTCEIIFYNSALTDSQRQQVEGYLASKWGLQPGIPSTHPFKRITP